MEPSDQLSALFDKFLTYLQSEPDSLEFLGEPPVSDPSEFDPYRMVAEWIALRHELKQQGKLLRSAQDTFQQSLETLQAQGNLPEKPANSSSPSQPSPFNKEQESLFRDLLKVMDAIDQACDHWQEIQTIHYQEVTVPGRSTPKHKRLWWQRWLFWWRSRTMTKNSPHLSSGAVDLDLLNSSREGLALIRRNLLDLLKVRQVIPMDALGKPFDARCMYAIGREITTASAPNTVLREVVRGYHWGDRVLREAQVIVAAQP